jgi:hypothetical protein
MRSLNRISWVFGAAQTKGSAVTSGGSRVHNPGHHDNRHIEPGGEEWGSNGLYSVGAL